jgi:hypothetical protein
LSLAGQKVDNIRRSGHCPIARGLSGRFASGCCSDAPKTGQIPNTSAANVAQRRVPGKSFIELNDALIAALRPLPKPVLLPKAHGNTVRYIVASKTTAYRPKGNPQRVNVHDFEDKKLGKVVPYGVYDMTANVGFVSVWRAP